jgi:thiamine biosynthesis lipoprotein
MGLPVRLVLHAPDRPSAEAAARAAFARISQLDRMMSDYRPDSELRRLEQHCGVHVPVSSELLAVVQRGLTIARASGGAFDPTIAPLVALWRESRTSGRLPGAERVAAARARVGWQHVDVDPVRSSIRLSKPGMRLDLGGIAKGYILQEAMHVLRAQSVTRALVQSGGDIVVGDAPPGRAGWQIDTPGADSAFAHRASRLVNAALATSGPTAQFVEIHGTRYSHVVDPRTGLGVTTSVVARVIAEDAATADALATALTIVQDDQVAGILSQFPRVTVSRRLR